MSALAFRPLLTWLAANPSLPSRSSAASNRGRPRRPRLEVLEDRTLPATITDLGALGGDQSSTYAYAVNASGQIAGDSWTTSSGLSHAFRYSNGSLTDLGAFGSHTSNAYGINDSGQVVGYSGTGTPQVAHAFLADDGGLADLGTLGGNYSVAYGINSSAQVVGYSSTSTDPNHPDYHAFLYSDGGMADLGSLGGTSGQSYARGINNSGQVVGYSDAPGNLTHAFLYSDGVMIDLGTLGGNFSNAYAINDAGQVVGTARTAGGITNHAYRYSDGVMTDLGTLMGGQTSSYAYGINASGQVVGSSTTNTDNHAFWYRNGTMIDLNTLLPGGSGWVLTAAWGINDAGRIITGNGLHNGRERAFLLNLNDVVVGSVRTTDSEHLTVDYDISRTITQPFQIGLFRSTSPQFDPQDNEPLGSIPVSGADESIGHHSLTVTVDGGLPPEFSPYHYVLAVADPDGSLAAAGYASDSNQATFRIYTIGAVSEGFSPGLPWITAPNEWVQTMADTLQSDGYDETIAFGWHSATPDSSEVGDAIFDLENQITQAVNNLGPLQDNDVIDLHLIGHSRGSVVVSGTMIEVLGSIGMPQFQHGYMKLTLLDPHPANLDPYGLNADYADTAAGITAELAYQGFEQIVQDPAIRVPARVNQLEVYFQHTPVLHDPSGDGESTLNLWGLNPDGGQIQIDDPVSTRVQSVDLTDVVITDRVIGHSEVHDYYQEVVLPGDGHAPTGGGSPPRVGGISTPPDLEQGGSFLGAWVLPAPTERPRQERTPGGLDIAPVRNRVDEALFPTEKDPARTFQVPGGPVADLTNPWFQWGSLETAWDSLSPTS
jgi:probable HAF family extracellular repeat protein